MINPYKRLDIFSCRDYTHSKFNHKVSAYHVLLVKNCYPQGCLYFKWRCMLLNKAKSCDKGFKHVGKKCFGCKHYYDEKINNQPELLLSELDYKKFLDELEEFEDWLKNIRGKSIDFWGIVRSVKPRLTKIITKDKSSLNLEGYILNFSDAYFDNLHWEDSCFAIIYADQQQRYKFAPDDDVEFKCKIDIDKGRLILRKIRAVDFRERSGKDTWDNSKALVAKGTTTFFTEQYQKCLHCDKGVLVDVVDKSNYNWERRRELFCLKAFPDPEICYYKAEKLLSDDCVVDFCS